ncbi:electron transport protein [Gorillibacterium sp. sgz5001074]|uniref:electron transport protein n=1 Tax=Gorillibacterium sp. sgz5001074 TaxID=3446695 RepID=UPI003F678E37
MRRFRILFGLYLFVAAVALGAAVWLSSGPEYVYRPSDDKVLNPERGGSVRAASEGDESGDPALGKTSFYGSTFGNEVFFTDIMGLFDGPFTLPNVIQAVVGLRGQGTDNLKVKAAKTATIAGQTIHEGDLIETGLDVPKGAAAPLGVRIKYADGRLKAGISCLVCHATVDDRTGKVALGVPNRDLNVGYLLAMATNTSAYFTHTQISTLQTYMRDLTRTVKGSDGQDKVLPDPELLEDAVDRDIIRWPRGSNDTTLDSTNNPVQIPDSITLGDHPYGWSGQGVAGPFKGLSAAINNAHAQNMDAMTQSELAWPVKDVDKELYIGTLLQRAATPKYRYDPASGRKPSDFFASVDPTPGMPGVNQVIPAPSYPRSSYMSAVGLFNSEPGFTAWQQVNSMSAWMNTLVPPKPRVEADARTVAMGEGVFRKAQCVSCHAGAFFTNNKIIPVKEIGTEPARAAGFRVAEKFFDPVPRMYAPNVPVPLPDSPEVRTIELTEEQRAALQLAWAQKGSEGGYKVPSLFGLSWSPPYLHDGGVAVGPDRERDLGIPGTWNKGVGPDAYNSLQALLDRRQRARVMEANKPLAPAHVTGEGHAFWVDEEAGFTPEEQDALIRYLLTIPGR